jgi:hypothetical protein
MKKLILTEKPNVNVIYKQELFQKEEYPIIGCIFGGNKIFFVNDCYRSKQYFARTNTRFGVGNGYSNAATMESWFEYFSGDVEWFVFDDSKELFKWLSE